MSPQANVLCCYSLSPLTQLCMQEVDVSTGVCCGSFGISGEDFLCTTILLCSINLKDFKFNVKCSNHLCQLLLQELATYQIHTPKKLEAAFHQNIEVSTPVIRKREMPAPPIGLQSVTLYN